MRSITQKDNSIVGHDRTEVFGNWNVDLFIFLDGYFADTVHVDGTSGVEEKYCGLEKAPCKNVNFGMVHLKKTLNVKEEIVVCKKSNITGCVDVGEMCVKAKEEAVVEIECQPEVSGSEECVLKSSSLTEMELITIVVPSSLSKTISTVIESGSANGELHMKNCEMSVIGGMGNTIGFFMIRSTGKMVELEFVTISDVKSSVSLFSFSLSSVYVNEQDYKVKLLNCTLQRLEIDSGVAVDGKASVFGESVEVGMVMNGSTIDGALSKKSKKGGALKIALSEGGFIAIEESSFTGCVCENKSERGKGGGIYLDCSPNEEAFQLSSISFSGCSATVGKNMFVKSSNLVNTVNAERCAIDCTNFKDDGNAIVGEDGTYEELDLRVFLVSLKCVVVSVSTGGHDTLGCGSDEYPCESMWSGISHIDRSGTEGERKVKVRGEGTIEDIYSFTDALVIEGCVIDGEAIKHKPIHFEGTIKGNSASSSSSIISSTVSLSLVSLKLQIPSQFEPNMNSLISSSGVLQQENCLFEVQSTTDIVQYSLISTTSGSCTLKGCSLEGCSFSKSPFLMASSVLFEDSSFSNIVNTESGEGGVAKVTLQGNEKLEIKLTNAASCSLSSGNGKGGFLYLDCQNCLNEKPFVFDADVTFKNNNAAIGKNAFIFASDLNKTVTNNTFKFDYSSMKDDETLFVGSDDFHTDKDLFMFLITFSSIEIFISSEGFDVARCGSEEEPCFTMWKGMKNMKEGDGMKTIQIEGSTIIRDSFDVSNYQIKKDAKMGEEDTKATLDFEKATDSQLEYFMENDIHLELSNIQLQLTSGFDNSAKMIISNKNGELVISECSFHSEAGVNNGFDCVFVDVIGGSVEVIDLSMESCNVGNNIFVIHDSEITCHLMNVRVKSLNESGGCFLLIKKSEPGLKINEGDEECVNIEINNSSFSGVKRSDNGASILESKSDEKICLVVNESNITEDKAEESEKGGAIIFTLCASGSMKIIDSTISHCSCSLSSGKGGGVYLATKERGELNFAFVGMKFSDNGASVGKDIFIECFNITSQISESQFQFDLRENHYSRINAIYGIDVCQHKDDTDLIDFVTIYQSDTIIVSSVNGTNDRQCGTNTLPCDSIDHGISHLILENVSLLYVDTKSVIGREINLEEMNLSSKSREMCKVEVKSEIEKTKKALVTTAGTVSLLRLNFLFDSNFISQHESLISPEGWILEVINCSFTAKRLMEGVNAEFANIPFHIINMGKGELQLDGCTISNLILQKPALSLSSSLPSVIDSLTICYSTIKTSLLDINESGLLTIKNFNTENITVEGNEESLITCLSMKRTIQLTNCTMCGVSSKTTKGELMKLENCLDVKMDSCFFDGSAKERNEQNLNTEEEMCRWNRSLVDITKSSVMMKDSTISNTPEGGIIMRGGNVNVEKGEFINNNPSIENYPSLRRNIICSDSGTLNVMSLKGGDGLKDNTSLWMVNEGCSFEGIASERDSSFFIPVLESVEAKEERDRMKLTFKGLLLIPCNLSFAVVKRKGEEKEIENYEFNGNGILSEREVEGSATKDLIHSCGDETEVSVHILFGNAEIPSSTQSFILKNRSEHQAKGDERIAEGGKEGKSFWTIIVIVLVVVLLIALIVSIVLIVWWRTSRRRIDEMEEAVNDTTEKDQKVTEMVSMEIISEEQWRLGEMEAEKKNKEMKKKRVFGSEIGQSEPSGVFLNENGSTEYIFGKDSNEIFEWEQELAEIEDIKKLTPSQSISSISLTSTTDSDSTFVLMEDLCPTTSSISNIVDVMACSWPYKKLSVDLRDSLFMLLHGRNEKKEMTIGSLQEREQTAARVLFFVVNGALHSFDEMEKELPSLANLNPHIVLFSEHMVICIAMCSDFPEESSDSSSISSPIIASSSSDISLMSERYPDSPPPSSVFENGEDNWKGCLRWKAPELLKNKKMRATKESVAFAIGMMLWECLTLEIPFEEFDTEIAGQKILSGEKPCFESIKQSRFFDLVSSCLSQKVESRPTLLDMKKELFVVYGKDECVMMMADTIFFEKNSEESKERSNCRKSQIDSEIRS